MKKILYISGTQIFPPHSGGQLRSTGIARGLANAGNEVFVYSFTGRKKEYLRRKRSETYHIAPNLKEYVDRSLFYGLCQFSTYRLGLPNLWMTLPHDRLYLPKKLKERIEWCDAVVLDAIFQYPLMKYIEGKKKILNSQNIESKLWNRSVLQTRVFTPIVDFIEKRAAKHVDSVICCTKEECDFYQQQMSECGVQVHLPNGVDFEKYEFSKQHRKNVRKQLRISDSATVFLFMASKYGPNKDAFLELEQFSALNKETLIENEIVLLTVGSVISEPIYEPHFIATGFVDEVFPYFSAADFALNLITSGAGSNVKMTEYMAANLPILSTEFGTRGFELSPEKDFVSVNVGNLIDKLKGQTKRPNQARMEMAKSAYLKNKHLIKMDEMVKNSVEPLLN